MLRHLFFLYLPGMDSRTCFHLQSPCGWLIIQTTREGLQSIAWTETPQAPNPPQTDIELHISEQLQAYFAGNLKQFDIPLKLEGTDFQKEIWQLLQNIPWGATTSYLQLAQQYGDPKAVRAVGMANNKNPIPIIVPCHRVIGSDGSLVGYAGGLSNKEWLLRHEGALKQLSLF